MMHGQKNIKLFSFTVYDAVNLSYWTSFV